MKKGFNLTDDMMAELEQQLNAPASDYITAEESIAELKKKYSHAIPKWQMEEVRRRGEEYLKDPSIGLDFDKVIKDIEEGL